MAIPLTDLKAQYRSIKGEIDAAIQRVVREGQFILGPEVKAFEEEMAAYCGTRFAIGVASGTDALHLALLACGIKPDDEVITTPFTFIAAAEVIARCHATPVFVDIDPRTYNLNPEQIELKITPRTKAIIPVHLYGQPANMAPILKIGKKHNLKIIEDCAQSLGAEYQGEKTGSIGNTGCLSFFPAKNLGAYGDGGMVVTNDPGIAEVVDILRKHGSKTSYYHLLPGFNSRLDAMQAAILRVKLKHLDEWNALRHRLTSLYTRLLSQIDGIEPPYVEEHNKPSGNYYTIRLKDSRLNRNGLRKHLEAEDIETAIYYPLSLHLQEVYKSLGYKPGDFPQSEQAQEQVLSLPMYPELSQGQVEEVAAAISAYYSAKHRRPVA
ncbi:MAG: transcriptional regulator [Dehalococcoidales bacterium]|jgi:dTDP-4-amino-4,6-dideoxygalactose transaminase|nr:transcriptional regulator [Dehalococcoidales bacterium]